MEYSDDKKQIEQWIPLVMEDRDPTEHVAATRMATGTDVDYGALTTDLLESLNGKDGFSLHFFSRVQDLTREGNRWSVRVRDEKTGEHRDITAKFVFIGAGGGSLYLLQQSGIPVQFGTELVGAADGSLVAMLGASPGASTAAWIMVNVIERCFSDQVKKGGWSAKLKELIPSYGQSLIDNPALCRQVRAETAAVLQINDIRQ
jgi:L-2-hydroxyglutarate oxidase LhgO